MSRLLLIINLLAFFFRMVGYSTHEASRRDGQQATGVDAGAIIL